MLHRKLIGKSIDLVKVTKHSDLSYIDNPEDQYLEGFLSAHGAGPLGDEFGYNAYSIILRLNEAKIVDLEQIGHCHLTGGQGTDTFLDMFPYPELNKEVEDIFVRYLTSDNIGKRQLEILRKERKEEENRTREEIDAIETEAQNEPDSPIGRLRAAVIRGDEDERTGTAFLVSECKKNRISNMTVLKEGLIRGFETVLRLHQNKVAYIPELLMSLDAFYAGKETLDQFSSDVNELTLGKKIKVVDWGGTVFKQIYRLCYEILGWTVINLEFPRSETYGNIANAISGHEREPICIFIMKLIDKKDILDLVEKIRETSNQLLLIGGEMVPQEHVPKIPNVFYLPDPLTGIDIITRYEDYN